MLKSESHINAFTLRRFTHVVRRAVTANEPHTDGGGDRVATRVRLLIIYVPKSPYPVCVTDGRNVHGRTDVFSPAINVFASDDKATLTLRERNERRT